jgi:hypothetical protein
MFDDGAEGLDGSSCCEIELRLRGNLGLKAYWS